MELNPFKWFGKKTPEHKKSSRGSVLEFLPGFDDEAISEIQRLARSLSSSGVSESAKKTNQNDLKDLADRWGFSQGELMIYIYNASIDQEAVRRHGETGEKLINSLGALSEMNVYNAVKGNLPKWMEENFPLLSRIAAKSASVRALATGAVVFGGGVASAAIGIPLLGLGVATAASAVAGYDFARRLSRLSAKEKFENYRRDIAGIDLDNEDFIKALQENGSLENENGDLVSVRAAVKQNAEHLIQGGHRFGEVLGLTKDGFIDMDSQEAKLLFAYEEVLTLESDEEKMQKEIFSTTDPDAVVSRIARTDDAVEADFQRLLISKRTEGMQRITNALRGDQKKEKRHGAIGALAGGVLGNVARACGAVAWRGQTLQEFAQSHFSVEANTKGIRGAAKIAGDAITDVRLKMGVLHIPRGIKLEPLAVSGGGGTPPFAAVEATRAATVSPGATESTLSMPPVSPGATVDAPAQPAASGSAGASPSVNAAEPAQPGSGSARGIPGGKAEAPAQQASARTPGVPVRVPDQLESFPDKAPAGMPEDWAMLKFLGQQLGDEVQKNLASARAGSFPASERGTLLNVLYNLKEQGLIRMEGDHVVLKTDDATLLGRMYQESHASPHATADTYGKKIGLEHWKEWFGGENSTAPAKGGVYEFGSKEHLAVEKGLVTDDNIEDVLKGTKIGSGAPVYQEGTPEHLSAEKGLITDSNIDEAIKKLEGKGIPAYEEGSMAHLKAEQGLINDGNIDEALKHLKGAAQPTHSRIVPEPVRPATPSIAAEAVSVAATESAATQVVAAPESVAAKVVSVAASESITGAIAEQHPASVSAKVEPPIPEKITAQTVDTGGKISGTAVSGEGTGHIKAEAVAEAPKTAPVLSATELAQQVYQHMQDSLYKKYGINPHIVDYSQSYRVSYFLEKMQDVAAGKTNVKEVFGIDADQYSGKEWEKLTKYLTDHDPNAGEKRMLLKNYLLSKEK